MSSSNLCKIGQILPSNTLQFEFEIMASCSREWEGSVKIFQKYLGKRVSIHEILGKFEKKIRKLVI